MGAPRFNSDGEDQDARVHELRGRKHAHTVLAALRLSLVALRFPLQGRTVHAYYAGGNGGQTVIVIPELDMVLSTWAGNYASLVGLKIQEELIPKYILPAIKD